MKLHDLRPRGRSPHQEDPGRARHRGRQGQDRRPRHEGPEVPRRRRRSRPGSRAARRRSTSGSRSCAASATSTGSSTRSSTSAASAPPPRPGRLAEGEKGAPIAVTQELLRVAGLVRSLDKPLKILGGGDVGRPLFVIADAFTRSARAKIEAAGGSVQLLEIPTSPLAALGVGAAAGGDAPPPAERAPPSAAAPRTVPTDRRARLGRPDVRVPPQRLPRARTSGGGSSSSSGS